MSDLAGLTRQRHLLDEFANFRHLPYAFGPPGLKGVIRREPGDFVVSETLPYTPAGDGEHLYLRVRKVAQNTRWVARRLAEKAGLPFRAVGYAGLKDRHGITDQWFSLHLPGRADPGADDLSVEGVEILESCRHTSKLRIGSVESNRFRIVVRDLSGDETGLEGRMTRIAQAGVPNYFGPQRFGRDRSNLSLLLEDDGPSRRSPRQRLNRRGREVRSFGLSALRSGLFNGYLSARVADRTWSKPLSGEMVYESEARSYSHFESACDTDPEFIPTGLLWGVGQNQATGEALAKEQILFSQFDAVTAVLESYEVRMSRRPLVLKLFDLSWSREGNTMIFEFTLGRGGYATSVLREVVDVTDQGLAPPPPVTAPVTEVADDE